LERRFGALEVRFQPMLETRQALQIGGVLFLHSEAVAAQALIAKVMWHDARPHCPTWTDAAECRCDVEGSR
jgi:hypothetical protein